MAKKMLIDGTYPEEARVVILDNQKVDDWDYKTTAKKQQKGNVYLGKITRIESSLQAAFVDFGDDKQGFLPFSEIHPDYYHIPLSDRPESELESEAEAEAKEASDEENAELASVPSIPNLELLPIDWSQKIIDEPMPALAPAAVELSVDPSLVPESDAAASEPAAFEEVVQVEEPSFVEQEDDEETPRHTSAAQPYKRYKIQEVIRRNQIVLVQVSKEERGNKGASLTSYISLAGRYSVLMPNSDRQGGISRRIADSEDRRRLKQIIDTLNLAEGTSIIVRTAGSGHSKEEIYRDYDYLARLWNSIRENTLKSKAPCFIHAEGDLIKRAVRDMYSASVEEIIVQGEQAYKETLNFLKMLIPTHTKKVKQYKQRVPLFQRFRVEEQLNKLYQHNVSLESGGYIVINPTEALVSIDVNSGKSTSERNVEETALKTNLEAAYEIGRQIRLRDLAGIVVIDFIDMLEGRHRNQVERAMRDAVAHDRAKIQLGRISTFGILEMSRQRLSSNVFEANNHICPTCDGKGMVRASESLAMTILRTIEAEIAQGNDGCSLIVQASPAMVLFLLNQKRQELSVIEERYRAKIQFNHHSLASTDYFNIQKSKQSLKKQQSLTQLEINDDMPEYQDLEDVVIDVPAIPATAPAPRAQSGRGRRNWHKGEDKPAPASAAAATSTESDTNSGGEALSAEEGEKRAANRRRPRRRGRERNRRPRSDEAGGEEAAAPATGEDSASAAGPRKPYRKRENAAQGEGQVRQQEGGEPSLLKGIWKRIMDH